MFDWSGYDTADVIDKSKDTLEDYGANLQQICSSRRLQGEILIRGSVGKLIVSTDYLLMWGFYRFSPNHPDRSAGWYEATPITSHVFDIYGMTPTVLQCVTTYVRSQKCDVLCRGEVICVCGVTLTHVRFFAIHPWHPWCFGGQGGFCPIFSTETQIRVTYFV